MPPISRIIDPPLTDLKDLRPPLTVGEMEVLQLFNDELPDHWEIYFRPHLNGLRPDFVLLSPKVGVAVFEVKDWNLSAMHYGLELNQNSNRLQLYGVNAAGKKFRIEKSNPLEQAHLYKQEIYNLYCPRLESRSGFGAITAGVIFTRASQSQVAAVFQPLQEQYAGGEEKTNNLRLYPIACREHLDSRDLHAIFPDHVRTTSKLMDEDTAEDLRSWLKEPAFSKVQRTPLELNQRQREFVTTRTESGYRRIKGPAGSGKSLIISARAAELVDQGKSVLVASYNITLLNYLRDLAARHISRPPLLKERATFLNFHAWCKRACTLAGEKDRYKAIWAKGDSVTEDVLKTGLAKLMLELYSDRAVANRLPAYDAILVDEGQDYNPLWWDVLRQALKPNGEMMLVADKTQDIYETAGAWTEDAMTNAGFRGPWSELRISYRLPPALFPLVESFIQLYMANEDTDVPIIERQDGQMQLADLYPLSLTWLQATSTTDQQDACVQAITSQMKSLLPDTAVADITFLSDSPMGSQVVERLAAMGIKARHTFGDEGSERQRQKRAFFQGDARIKATTLHSFKGWEARHLVVHVGSCSTSKDRALIYTSITRLRRHEHGSMLTVVSGCPDLERFGKTWPTFRRC